MPAPRRLGTGMCSKLTEPLTTRRYAMSLLATGAAAAVAIILNATTPPPAPPPPFTSAFRLVSHDGVRVDSGSLPRAPYAVFFGFTSCPAVCSASLMELIAILNEIGRRATEFKVYFVTLDPERDTPAVLGDFASSFGSTIVGLTGSPEEIAAAARSFGVFYRRVPLDGGGILSIILL
jgi:protein SCO1/2